MHKAIAHGHAGVVEELLKHGVALDVQDDSGQTAQDLAKQKGNAEIIALFDKYKHEYEGLNFEHLRNSIEKGDIPLAKFLIHAGVPPIAYDGDLTYAKSSLCLAASKGLTDLVDFLLRKDGVDVNTRSRGETGDGLDNRNTPLHCAAVSEKKDESAKIIQLLLKRGADINARNDGGVTPLEKAASSDGSLEGLKVLLERGDNLDYNSALYKAMERLDVEKVRLLAKNASAVPTIDVMNALLDSLKEDQQLAEKTAILKLWLNGGGVWEDINNLDIILNRAMEAGRSEMASMLLYFKNEKITPFVKAIQKGREKEVIEMVKQGADVNLAIYHKDGSIGKRPLHFAIAQGGIKVIERLLEEGADPDLIGDANTSPLDLARETGAWEIVGLLSQYKQQAKLFKAIQSVKTAWVEKLLSSGARIDLFYKGRQPLHWAAAQGDPAVVRLLLARGAALDVLNTKDRERGMTPLHFAVLQGHEGIVAQLLENGAQVDGVDREKKRTPLYLAVLQGHEGIAAQLLENGARLDNSVLALAREQEDWDMINLLKRYEKPSPALR